MRWLVTTFGLLALACAACTSATTDDGTVTGEEQNLEEVPCKPLASLVCAPGYTTISLLNCPSGHGRCSAGGGCELASTIRCVAGHAPTSTHCKGKGAARCAPIDGGAGDAGSSDASRDARHD